MNKKNKFLEFFYILCWIFIPIGFPFFIIMHLLKRKENINEYEQNLLIISDASKQTIFDYTEKKLNNSISVVKKSEEIIDDLLFEISSDISCGRSERALESITIYLNQNKKIKYSFIKSYFKNEYFLNPDLFQVTILFLSITRTSYKNFYLNLILNNYPLHFSIGQLNQIYQELGFNHEMSNNSPLLLCFLTNDINKLYFYLNIGYDPENVICKLIYYDCSQKNSIPSDTFYNVLKLKPKIEYLGKKLSFVLEAENIKYKHKSS